MPSIFEIEVGTFCSLPSEPREGVVTDEPPPTLMLGPIPEPELPEPAPSEPEPLVPEELPEPPVPELPSPPLPPFPGRVLAVAGAAAAAVRRRGDRGGLEDLHLDFVAGKLA